MTFKFPMGTARANSLPVVVAIAALSVIAQSDARADTVFAAVTDGSLHAVATFNDSLGLINQITLPGPITGLAAGTGGDFYTAVGDSIFEYDAAGAQIGSISAAPGTTLPALSFASDVVFAAVTDGSLHAVATFNDSLGLINQITLPGPITGLAAGPGGDFYTAVGDSIFEYDAAGAQIGSISAAPGTTLPALSFANGVAYAAVTDGSFNAVATLNESLGLINQITLPGPITGLAAGTGSDFYTAVGDSIFEYDAAGAQIASISAAPGTTLPALSFFAPVAPSVPEPSSLVMVATGLAALWPLSRRRIKDQTARKLAPTPSSAS
jgi:PEP-CTERM motif